ncbi:MAG TPA: porin family protein [Saprospiraceae bacterium]|nr:porin family protein [Saprospiraceae bacterium]
MKKILLISLICWAALLPAQQQATRSFVWGGMVGIESQLLNIQSTNTSDPEQMRVETGRTTPGASVGVFGRWQIGNGIFAQQALSISTSQSKVDFYPGGTEYYRFTDLELPLHLVLTNPANEDSPVRGSFLLGMRVGWNFAAQNSDNLQFLSERLAVDAGLGVEIRLNNWRLQPEFVYSLGLNNIHDVTNAPFDWVVGRVVRDKLTLRLLIWMNEKR